MSKKRFTESALSILLVAVIMFLVVVGLGFVFKSQYGVMYDDAVQASEVIQKYQSYDSIKEIFVKYAIAMSAGLVFVYLLLAYVIYGVLALFGLGKLRLTAPLFNLVALGGWAGFVEMIAFTSAKNTALACAIIFYVAYPVFFASVVGIILSIIFLLMSIKPSAKISAKILVLALVSSLLSGCDLLGEVIGMSCGLSSDSAHCYQQAAIQQGDSETCEKIKQPDDFKSAGSNPPKDKCLMQIAETTEKAEVCNKMQGGMFSYQPSECVQNVAEKKSDPTVCTLSDQVAGCVNAVAEQELPKIQSQIDKLATQENVSPEDLAKVQEDLAKYQQFSEMLIGIMKQQHDMSMTAVRNLK